MNSHGVKRFLGILALVVVALIVVTIIAVELISWNFLKPRIAAQVESATGRELSIDGDVEIDLLPRPRITLHDVTLANPDWASSPHFLEIERLRAAPDLLALATGQIELARVELEAPVVRLIQRSDGPANWVMGGEDEGGSEPMPIHRLDVTNGEIQYQPAGEGQKLNFRMPAMRMQDDGESSSIDGTLAVRGREIDIEADTDSLFSWASEDSSFDGELRLSTDESHIDSEFSLSKPSFPAESQVRVDAEIADAGHWIGLVPGADSTEIGALEFEASLARSGSTWKAEEVDIRAMESRLQADLEVDTSGEVPELSGSIRSESISVDAIRKALPVSDSSAPQSETFPPPPILPQLAGSLDVDIGQIEGLAVPINGAKAQLRFDSHRVAAENITVTAAEGTVSGSLQIKSAPDTVSATVALSAEGIRLGEGEESGPTLDGDFDLQLDAVSREGWSSETIARHLNVDTARIAYSNPQKNTQLSATGELAGEEARPVVTLSGTLRGRPLEAEIEGGGLATTWPGPAYSLAGEASSASLALSADTTLRSVLNTERFEGRLSLSGDSVGDLEPLLELDLMPTPPFHVSGRFDRDGAQWKADELLVEVGESTLRGSAQAQLEGRPHITAKLEAEPLDLRWLQSGGGAQGGEQESGNGSSDLAWLRGFDADLQIDATEVKLADAPNLNGLELKATLEQGVVDVQRFATGIAGGTFSFDGQIDAAETPASARIDVRFDDIALTRLGDSFSPLEERLGILSGNLHVVVTQTLAEAYRDDVLAPMIGRLKIEPSELHFVDPEAGTDLSLSLKTEGLDAGKQRFSMDGSGRYDGDPVSLRYRSDTLLDIRLPDRPYAVDLDLSIVDSRIELDGTLLRPLAIEGLDLQLAVAGPNPERLSRLLGVPLPDLPPYEVSGQLEWEQGRWALSNLDGTAGESDLGGRLAFDAGTSPPTWIGDLHSDSLYIEDLAGVVGAEPTAGEKEASQEDRFILPSEPLIGDAWREVMADVRYRANSVRGGGVPLSELALDFQLIDGVARFEPIGFAVGDGRVDLILELDASRQPTQGDLSVEVRGVDLREALKEWDLADDSVGIVAAQGKFWVTGESIAELLGSADGGLVLLMTEGRLEALLVELAGLDAGQAFLTWVRDRPGIPINCAYADLQARDGVVQIDTFVIDSEDTIFTVGGQVDLADERLDVSFVAHPQDASALIGRTPFHLGGTFDDIEVGIHGGELGMRIGASVGLAALAGPLAAVIPLLEAGGDDRTGYCQGLVERTKSSIETEENGS